MKSNTDLRVGVPGKLIVLGVIVSRPRHFRRTINHPIDVALGVASVELAAARLGQRRRTISAQRVREKGGGWRVEGGAKGRTGQVRE